VIVTVCPEGSVSVVVVEESVRLVETKLVCSLVATIVVEVSVVNVVWRIVEVTVCVLAKTVCVPR
jgi:hypothetical protein